MPFTRDNFNAADLEFGISRPLYHEHDHKYRLLVLEIQGVESKEACKGMTALARDHREVAIALYRAAYYDAVEKAAGTFTAETSHVKFVTVKLRKTHQATPTHWRLGVDAKLTVEVFDSYSGRGARAHEIDVLPREVGNRVFSDSPSQWFCFMQEDVHSDESRFDQPTFEESYMEDECLVTMSDKEIVESKPDWGMYCTREAAVLMRLLKAYDGNVSCLRKAQYDEFCPSFLEEIIFEANLLQALKRYLVHASAVSAFSSSAAAAAAGASTFSAAGPLLFTLPSPYCELASMEHTSHQSLVDQCKAELSKQTGNHIAAMAAIYKKRDQLADKAMDLVYDDAEQLEKERTDEEDTDSELEQLKDRCRDKLAEYGMKTLSILSSCFLVALLGAMQVAVETFEAVSPREEKPQADAASAGDKRKTSEKDNEEGKEKEPSEAGPSPKKAKQ